MPPPCSSLSSFDPVPSLHCSSAPVPSSLSSPDPVPSSRSGGPGLGCCFRLAAFAVRPLLGRPPLSLWRSCPPKVTPMRIPTSPRRTARGPRAPSGFCASRFATGPGPSAWAVPLDPWTPRTPRTRKRGRPVFSCQTDSGPGRHSRGSRSVWGSRCTAGVCGVGWGACACVCVCARTISSTLGIGRWFIVSLTKCVSVCVCVCVCVCE